MRKVIIGLLRGIAWGIAIALFIGLWGKMLWWLTDNWGSEWAVGVMLGFIGGLCAFFANRLQQ